MRPNCIAWVVPTLLVSLIASAGASEQPPLSPVQAAQAVLAAIDAKDDAALRELAAPTGSPDPWLVVDALIGEDKHDAAAIYARVARGRASSRSRELTALSSYVEARRGKPDDRASRKALMGWNAAARRGDLRAALAALRGFEPNLETVVGTYIARNVAYVHFRQQGVEKSLPRYLAVAAAAERLGWYRLAAEALHEIGAYAYHRSQLPSARQAYREAVRIQMRRGRPLELAESLDRLADVYRRLGWRERALDLYQRALGIFELSDHDKGIAGTLIDLGILYRQYGELAKALDHCRRGIEYAERAGYDPWLANGLETLGACYVDLGEPASAKGPHERALAIRKTCGDKRGVASSLYNLGIVARMQADFAKALEHLRQAYELRVELGEPGPIGQTLREMAGIHRKGGTYRRALELYQASLRVYEKGGMSAWALTTKADMGTLAIEMGEYETGVGLLESCAREAHLSENEPLRISVLTRLARAQIDAGHAGAALEVASQTLQQVAGPIAAIGGLHGRAAGRVQLISVGCEAAVREGDAAAALHFMEEGRARGLQQQLAGRSALAAAPVPEDLIEAEARARAHAAVTVRDYREALAEDDREWQRDCRKDVVDARMKVHDAVLRAQHAAWQAADLPQPKASSLEDVRGALLADEALVLYAEGNDEILALVITKTRASTHALGPASPVREAAELLGPSEVDATAFDRLRAALVTPLDLPKTVKTVLVSPHAALYSIPLGALFGRPTSWMESGSILVHLRAQAATPGKGMLAVTEAQAEAAELGAEVLAGAKASRAQLVERLTSRPRWAALHISCPVELHAEHPLLSCVVLTPAEHDDGRLLAMDVRRLHMPCDLVVLASCESARSFPFTGEGPIGLPRAFVAAGAPRVLASLWKADDEATRALMVQFHTLCKPGEGGGMAPAQALSAAQGFVRAQPRWADPRYWAGWVLYGLP